MKRDFHKKEEFKNILNNDDTYKKRSSQVIMNKKIFTNKNKCIQMHFLKNQFWSALMF